MKKNSYIFPFIYIGLILILLLIFVFPIFFIKFKYFSLKKEKEGFFEEKYSNNNKKTIILLGDSILNNRSYVAPGDSVEELLKKRTTDTIYNFAQDDATIQNVIHKINQIPEHLNNHNTTIFLSLGGNDIIHYYIKNKNDLQDTSILNHLFIKYETIVHIIREKMNKNRLFLLDIYYPTNNSFQRYKPILQEWNRLLETFNYRNNNNNNNIHILKISQYFTQREDFTDNIEPSKIGGEKIANLILQSIA